MKDRVKIKIARVFYDFDTLPEFNSEVYQKQVERILSIPELARGMELYKRERELIGKIIAEHEETYHLP